MQAPYKYDDINLYNSRLSPSVYQVSGSGLANLFKRHLFNRLQSVFEFQGVPETWATNYYMFLLMGWGYFVVLDTEKYGVIPQNGTLSGYNVFYQPYSVIVANPLLPKVSELVIGKDCEIVRLAPDWRGAWDLVDYYGDCMALIAETLGMNITNSKLSYAFTADSKQAAESFKKLYDKVQAGEPAVVFDKKLFGVEGEKRFDSFLGNVRQNFIASDLQTLMEQMGDDFDAWVGIPNNNVRKNAHVLQDELHANDVSTYSAASLWLQTIRESLCKVNKMFGLSISCDFRFKPEFEGGETDEVSGGAAE